jgi:hypothetical protein
VWFSGDFTYYLFGSDDDAFSKLRRSQEEIREVYGAVGPSTVWNLIPFSWAADWITNTGDVLTNIEAFARDGLVMHYGYIMERCEVHVDRVVRGAYLGDIDPSLSTDLPSEVRTSFSIIQMRRRKATPFAFGLNQADLTTRQWAILGALGIQFSGL